MIPWLFAALALPAIALGLAIVDPGALFALGFIPIVAALALWVAIAGSRLSVAGLARTYAIPGATAVTLMVGALLVGGLIPEIAQRTARDMVEQPFNAAGCCRRQYEEQANAERKRNRQRHIANGAIEVDLFFT